MQLPIEISPNPLVTSAVEIRFNSDKSVQQVFPLMYSKFMDILPTLKNNILSIDEHFNETNLPFLPAYILNNEDYTMAFSNRVLGFGHVDEYTLWGKYFPFIQNCLNDFFSLQIANNIERIGVRYASIFEVGSIKEIINNLPTLSIPDHQENFIIFKSDLFIGEYKLHVQLIDNAKIKKDSKLKSGAYIDIDASYSGNLNPGKNVYPIIDELHFIEKKLFVNLLKPDFLNNLDVKY